MKNLNLTFILAALASTTVAQRPVAPNDVYNVRHVDELEVSPDKKWIAYTVSTADSVEDKYDDNIWMVAADGGGSVQVTHSAEDESSPRWSPDNKWLSFLASRGKGEDNKTQLWVLDRRGGEARQLTSLKVDIGGYAWSPDSKRLLLEIKDQEIRPDSMKDKPAKPIVIDRYHFKEDVNGYLENRRTHLYLFDMETKKLDTLTKGNFDYSEATWSSDGKLIAFTSNQTTDPDRNTNSDVWVMDAKAGAKARKLTTWADYDRHPTWSPDGKTIAYLRSVSEEGDVYDEPLLAIIDVAGGEPKLLTKSLDRPVTNPEWTSDSHSIVGLIEDDRQRYVMQFDAASGAGKRLSTGDRSVTIVKPLDGNRYAVLMSEPDRPKEVYILENDKFTKLTSHNDDFVKTHHFASAEGFTFRNNDKQSVSGILYWPNAKPKGQKLPLILWIHGGPVAQDEYEFDLTTQVLAAQGYAVAAINYRGSNGRGYAFARSIFGDWGHHEVVDLIAGVNHLIKAGIADEKKLGIGGWSYGGILTDYVTATDSRFKAAASGAGSAMQLSMYGTDQYTQQYEMELGLPWKSMEKWLKVSYPFFKADRIKTPTLYMVGESDFNVPAAGSEQMYQALRTLGIPTQFVIYPKQHHGLTVPGYWKDRYQRYITWYKTYLK